MWKMTPNKWKIKLEKIHFDILCCYGVINPVTYGILRFCQLGGGGGGAFWPESTKQSYGYKIDLKFSTNNGTDDTSKHAKYKVIGCSTFRDMTSQKFPLQKGMSHLDSIFTP